MTSPFAMLSDNSKFGDKAFSLLPHDSCIPAGIATELCKGRCYGFKSYADRPRTFAFIQANHPLRQRPHFQAQMAYQIQEAKVKDFRIHTIGDFDTAEYLTAWIEIVTACIYVRFLAYTRAWRKQEFIDGLTELASLSNMNLWLSEDAETGRSPKIPETRVAWFADHDGQLAPDYAKMVFRGTAERLTELYHEDGKLKARRHYTPLKVMGSSPVCLHQNGLPNMPETCVACRVCMWRTK